MMTAVLLGEKFGLSSLNRFLIWFAMYGATWHVGFLLRRYWSAEIYSYQEYLGRFLVTQLLVGMGALLCVINIAVTKGVWDDGATIHFVIFILVLLFLSLGGGLVLARRLGVFKPLPAAVQNVLSGLLPPGQAVPPSFTVRTLDANAFAIPSLKWMLFSDHLLRYFTAAEIGAIARHELAHLRESKWVLAGRMSIILVLAPLAFIRPIAGSGGFPAILRTSLTAFLIYNGILLLSRRMERRADAQASATEGNSELVYARALEKLYQHNFIPAVLNNRGTHPHLYDRLLAAGAQPEYDRPKAPGKLKQFLAFAGTGVVFALIYVLLESFFRS